MVSGEKNLVVNEGVPTKCTIALCYAVDGDVRFLSHRDMIRLWHRVLTRSELPVLFSRGFNPRIRMSLVLPRSVGMASREELLVFTLTEPWSPEKLLSRLEGMIPAGIEIVDVHGIGLSKPPRPSWVRYQIHLSRDAERARIRKSLEDYERAESRPVYRPRRGRHPERTIDLKTMVTELALKTDGLYCTLDLSGEVSARLGEVEKMLGISRPGCVAKTERIAVGYAEEPGLKNYTNAV